MKVGNETRKPVINKDWIRTRRVFGIKGLKGISKTLYDRSFQTVATAANWILITQIEGSFLRSTALKEKIEEFDSCEFPSATDATRREACSKMGCFHKKNG